MKTYTIVRTDTGQVTGTQTVADNIAPALLNGQAAIVTPTGFRIDTGSFSAAGPDASPMSLLGDFNVTLSGTFAATIVLERSFDGTTWFPVTFVDGTPLLFTAPTSTQWSEAEIGVLYRLNCTSYVSGTPVWRVSQ